MGYIRHHAILVTASYEDCAEKAHKKATEMAPAIVKVSALSEPAMNSTQSFACFPDGSKEGWSESDLGDAFRETFTQWLREQAFDDGSSHLHWVVVQYGDDNREATVVDAGDWHRATPDPEADHD